MRLLEPESVFWDLSPGEISAMAEAAQRDRGHAAARQDPHIAPVVAARRAAWIELDDLMRASRVRRVRDLPDLSRATRIGWMLGYLRRTG
jgi:hypothetical protein